MSWPKIKNIIILILLATNVCLSVFTMNRQSRAEQLQKQPRSEAIAFLQSRDIQVREETVPHRMELIPMQVTRNIEQERVLAEELLEGTVSSELRGADVYRYFNDRGSIQFHSNGEFSARFYDDVYRLEDDRIEEYSASVLERIEFYGQLIRMRAEGDEIILTYCQHWKDSPLFNCQVQVNYRNDTLISVTGGRRLSGVPEESAPLEQITVATALIRFYNEVKALGDACTQIKEITQGYILTSAITEPVSMTPVWQIVTDTCTYQMDTLTGQVSRIQ